MPASMVWKREHGIGPTRDQPPGSSGEGLRVRRALVAAMEQQMWFFGCDAACADGNLLVRYGFTRSRPETPLGKSSCYHVDWKVLDAAGCTSARIDVHGWSAGLHATPASTKPGGFLYLRAGNRLGWYDSPRPLAPAEVANASVLCRHFSSLGRKPEAGFCCSASLFLRWVEEYERWIEATCGADYRRRCHARAPLPWLPSGESRAWLASYGSALLALVAG